MVKITVASLFKTGLSGILPFLVLQAGMEAQAQCSLSNCPVPPHVKVEATIPWVETVPTIDGVIDPIWAEVDTHAIARSKDDPPRPAREDYSGHWRGMWDGTNLYILVSVRDEKAKLWNGSGRRQLNDMFELYMDADFSQPPGWFGRHPKGFCWEVPRGPKAPHEGHKGTTAHTFAQGNSDTGWTMEMKFPLATYKVTPAAGDFMGLEINVSDADDGTGRDIASSWNDNGDRAWANPQALGKLIFGAKGATSIAPRYIRRVNWKKPAQDMQPYEMGPILLGRTGIATPTIKLK